MAVYFDTYEKWPLKFVDGFAGLWQTLWNIHTDILIDIQTGPGAYPILVKDKDATWSYTPPTVLLLASEANRSEFFPEDVYYVDEFINDDLATSPTRFPGATPRFASFARVTDLNRQTLQHVPADLFMSTSPAKHIPIIADPRNYVNDEQLTQLGMQPSHSPPTVPRFSTDLATSIAPVASSSRPKPTSRAPQPAPVDEHPAEDFGMDIDDDGDHTEHETDHETSDDDSRPLALRKARRKSANTTTIVVESGPEDADISEVEEPVDDESEEEDDEEEAGTPRGKGKGRAGPHAKSSEGGSAAKKVVKRKKGKGAAAVENTGEKKRSPFIEEHRAWTINYIQGIVEDIHDYSDTKNIDPNLPKAFFGFADLLGYTERGKVSSPYNNFLHLQALLEGVDTADERRNDSE